MGVRDLVVRFPLLLVRKGIFRGPKGCLGGRSIEAHVCFRCRVARLVLTELYWLNLPLTSLSMLTSSWGSRD